MAISEANVHNRAISLFSPTRVARSALRAMPCLLMVLAGCEMLPRVDNAHSPRQPPSTSATGTTPESSPTQSPKPPEGASVLTATPSPRPIAGGLWFVFCRDAVNELETEFIAFHVDSGTAHSSPLGDWSRCFDVYPSPIGDRLAYLASPQRSAGTEMRILSLPSFALESEWHVHDQRTSAVEAQWSPDGRYLAYSVYGSDPPGELVTIDTSTGVSDTAAHSDGHIDSPTWSPTGDWLAFREASDYDPWTGPTDAKVRVASPSTGEDHILIAGPEDTEIVLGPWTAEGELLVMDRHIKSAPDQAGESFQYATSNLRAIHPQTAELQVLFAGEFDDVITNPLTGTALVSSQPTDGSSGTAFYLTSSSVPSPRLVTRTQGHASASWLPEAKAYAIVGNGSALLVDVDGRTMTRLEVPGLAHVSPDAQSFLAYERPPSEDQAALLQIFSQDGTLIQELETPAPYLVAWRPDSQGFIFTTAWGDVSYLQLGQDVPLPIGWVFSEAGQGAIPFFTWSNQPADT